MSNPDYKTEPARYVRTVPGGAEVVYESSSIRAVVELRRILIRDGQLLVRKEKE